MDVVDLRYYLVAVVDAGNFTRAARRLGLNASTVSRRIARLEDELGLTAFERSRAGIRLTAGGRAVMVHVRRVLADFDAVARAGHCNGSGEIGEIRLGIRMPPLGEPLRSLLATWRKRYPNVGITLYEMNERDTLLALEERRLDAVLATKHTLWPHVVAVPIYCERINAALPEEHVLAARDTLDWASLREEIFLVQGWDESQSAREFYASFLGSGTRFRSHPASKQSVLALVGAGFGVTLATMIRLRQSRAVGVL